MLNRYFFSCIIVAEYGRPKQAEIGEVREMGDCIVRLGQLIDQLPPAEARVARYLLDHCQEVIGQPIEKVSEACQTSKTTVVRLCKQLGFKGYKALSIALSMELASGGENRISIRCVPCARPWGPRRCGTVPPAR